MPQKHPCPQRLIHTRATRAPVRTLYNYARQMLSLKISRVLKAVNLTNLLFKKWHMRIISHIKISQETREIKIIRKSECLLSINTSKRHYQSYLWKLGLLIKRKSLTTSTTKVSVLNQHQLAFIQDRISLIKIYKLHVLTKSTTPKLHATFTSLLDCFNETRATFESRTYVPFGTITVMEFHRSFLDICYYNVKGAFDVLIKMFARRREF